MHLAVVGSGYVGLVAGVCFAELGHEVVLVDNDVRKVESLRAGKVPIHEEHLQELLARNIHNGRLEFTESLCDAVRTCSVIFIAVGTPPLHNGEADLSYIEAVAREIACNVDDYKIIVEKSTVPVLTHDWIRRVMLMNGAPQESFDVVSNPEFLREGTAIMDFLYGDRIVVGVDSPRAEGVLRLLYSPLVDGDYAARPDALPAPEGQPKVPQLIVTTAKSAELIKHASNAFLAVKISFINAVACIAEAVGADIQEICEGMGSDSRIGPRFLRPGLGFGGSCFPKDLKAFRSVARECGYDFALLDAVIGINEEQRSRFLRKVRSALWTLKSKRVAVLGLAFKGGTDDIRESPAIAVVEQLLMEGCEVTAYDPAAMERSREMLGSRVQYAADCYTAAEGADCLLILTDWEEFAGLDLRRLKNALKYPIIVDGRNMFDCETMQAAGFQYHSVGRVNTVTVHRHKMRAKAVAAVEPR